MRTNIRRVSYLELSFSPYDVHKRDLKPPNNILIPPCRAQGNQADGVPTARKVACRVILRWTCGHVENFNFRKSQQSDKTCRFFL